MSLFECYDDDDVLRLVLEQPLAWVVSGAGEAVHATLLPLRPVVEAGVLTALEGHFPRRLEQVEQIRNDPRAQVLVLGPNGYVSASWLRDRSQAPTWTFASARFVVDVRLEDDEPALRAHLDDLAGALEAGREAPWTVTEMGDRYAKLAQRIVKFRATIVETHGRFKLGQDERDDVFADIAGATGDERLLAWMRRFNAGRAEVPMAGELDPEIRDFVERMGAEWRRHPALDSVPLPRAREIAERVRGRFATGGPTMARTSDHMVPLGDGTTVPIRVHDPHPGDPKPALVYLHGGGWTLFSIDTHDRIMREYAARAGIVVVGVDYSLSPEARFPKAIDETVAVIRRLRADGTSVGVDGARLALGGDSAGAAMTAGTCITLRDAGEGDAVRAMLLNYGCFDTACDTPSFRRYERGGYLWDPGEMRAYWRNYLGDANPRDPRAAPLHADVRGLPPAFLAIPECDVMYDESLAFGEKLRRAGVPAQSVVYPGATHSFLEAVSIARVSDRAFAEASRWLVDMLAVR